MIGKGVIAGGVAVTVLTSSFLLLGNPPRPECQAGATSGPALSVDPRAVPTSLGSLNQAQLRIAAIIIQVGAQRGLDRWTQQVAVATGLGESTLTNPSHGDAVRRDTIGTFQIGPEHGSYEDRMNPSWAAGNFYDRLLKVPGYHEMTPSHAAHKAQRNADPEYYSKYWPQAAAIMNALAKTSTTQSNTEASATLANTQPLAATRAEPRHYPLGRVTATTQRVADALGSSFGIRTIGGWRAPTSERYDQEGHPAGLAVDFMINDIPGGSAVGDKLASYLIANADQVGVKYIIWKQRSWTPQRNAWRAMADRGSPTQNHMDHVHLSLRPAASGTLPAGGGPSAANGGTTGCEMGASGETGGSVPVGPEGWAQPIATPPGQRSFGWRMHPVYHTMKMHQGQDFGAPCGTPIYAAAAGRVTFAGSRGGYGHLITLDHGNAPDGTRLTTRYGHMYANGVGVHAGQQVTAGQQIGEVGSDGTSTACHLHFEVRANETPVEPVTFLNERGVRW